MVEGVTCEFKRGREGYFSLSITIIIVCGCFFLVFMFFSNSLFPYYGSKSPLTFSQILKRIIIFKKNNKGIFLHPPSD